MKENSISSSLEARQLDEVNSIASIYGDIFKDITPQGLVWNKKPSPHFQVYLESSECPDRPTISVTLDFEFTPTYPLSPPKIKLLEPKNILQARLASLRKRVDELIKEYSEEEVCFVIISDLKDMLDEFQSTTEMVLSLEEERELRLRTEREQLEEKEAERERKREHEKAIQNAELNKQILKIRGEYDYGGDSVDGGADDENGEENNTGNRQGGTGAGAIDDESNLIPPAGTNLGEVFEFANTMVGQVPLVGSSGGGIKFKFRAVLGLVPYQKRGLLSDIGKQYIVKPYIPAQIQKRLKKAGANEEDVSYLLTEIELTNSYWRTDVGKRSIQDLESELQKVQNITHENIVSLVGFQIDESRTSKGWKVRLLTEFSTATEMIKDIISNTGNNRVSWGLARTWLIQLIPGFEHLQNCGVIHKMVCPLTVCVWETPAEAGGSSSYFEDEDESISEAHNSHNDTVKILKICHPSYGYTLLKMIEEHPNGSTSDLSAVDKLFHHMIPGAWMAPELTESSSNPNPGHVLKTDIWELGVLFIRIMLGYDILETNFKTPNDFYTNFKSIDYPGEGQYADIVYDLFYKMLMVKPSKRPSPMELNAARFLRDGPHDERDRLRYKSQHQRFPNTTNRDTTGFGIPGGAASVRATGSGFATSGGATRRPSLSYYDSQADNNVRNMGRYERDFEEVGKLGKGGFGEVVKARNRIEGTFYAIKKIKHRAHKLDSLLSEVLSLARLNHQYIVRYYGTWVEEMPDKKRAAVEEQEPENEEEEEEEESESESESEVESDSGSDLYSDSDDFDDLDNSHALSNFSRSASFLGTQNNSFQVDFVSNDPIIEFGYSTDEDAEENDDTSEPSTSTSKTPRTMTESRSRTQSRRKRERSPHAPPISQTKSILYIQMEFCENNTLQNLIEQGLPQNANEYWRLFRQILEAVSYIHREGFIHRDLKPMNIFIDKSNNVKLGDFGLAKTTNSPTNAEGMVVSKNNQVERTTAEMATTNKEWSTVVGTVFYTANEVATGNYDEKVDMYALGIIFFEMCWSLGTGMERAQTLNGLRLSDVRFPDSWKPQQQKWERKIIRLLLDHNPTKRPGAGELLSSGLLPVEHQDQIIREALKSLADPASPWQLQVRETLFKQPYVLARDLMFDEKPKRSLVGGGSASGSDGSSDDFLLFDMMIAQLKKIFKRYGAMEDFSQTTTNVLFPKSPFYSRGENCFEVLDKSGSILQLPYDLTLPLARFLSKNIAPFVKVFKNGFVYRQPGANKRPGSMPDKYSAVSFDIVSHDSNVKSFQDAECINVISEIVQILPNSSKDGQSDSTILINHSDILHSIINFSFDNVGIDERKRSEVVGILSQTGIELDPEQIKKRLREDASVPHTVTKDLIDKFNFTVPLDMARVKLKKAMMDSPHFIKVDKALTYILEVLEIYEKLGGSSEIMFNPLSNYNCKFYRGGLMFQAVHRVERKKGKGGAGSGSGSGSSAGKGKAARILSGGRYDSLIESFANKDMVKSMTPYAVGFQLSSTFMFLLLKKCLSSGSYSDGYSSSAGTSATGNNVEWWKRSRCDVLVSSLNPQYVRNSGYEILRRLRKYNIYSDLFVTDTNDSIEDILDQASGDGATWVVLIKTPLSQHQQSQQQQRAGSGGARARANNRSYKPLRVKNLCTGKDVDVDYEELSEYLRLEIDERNYDESGVPVRRTSQTAGGGGAIGSIVSGSGGSLSSLSAIGGGGGGGGLGGGNDADDLSLSPLFSVDLDQKVFVVPNDAPRGRKASNKREKWETENDAKIASSSLMKRLATAPIISLDVRDEVIQMIQITSLESKDEFIKKVTFSSPNFPRSFAVNIYNTLFKELSRGTKWVVLYSNKTQTSTIIDLER